MKDMSVEELLDDLSSYSDVSDEHYAIKAEIIRRFEALEKEVEKHKRTAICMYCGTVQQTKDGQEKLAMIIEHMAVCKKHPVPRLLAEKAVLEQRDEVWREKKSLLENDLAKAWVELKDARCCGNCKSYDGGWCRSRNLPFGTWSYCDHWTTDGLTRAEREGK